MAIIDQTQIGGTIAVTLEVHHIRMPAYRGILEDIHSSLHGQIIIIISMMMMGKTISFQIMNKTNKYHLPSIKIIIFFILPHLHSPSLWNSIPCERYRLGKGRNYCMDQVQMGPGKSHSICMADNAQSRMGEIQGCHIIHREIWCSPFGPGPSNNYICEIIRVEGYLFGKS